MKISLFYNRFLTITLLLVQLSGQLHAQDDCGPELDPDIEALLDPEIFELEAPLPIQTTCFPTQTIIDLLTPQTTPDQRPPVINLVNILKEDIYRKTTGPVTRRSLLDEPALIPDHLSNCYWSFNIDLFYNYSPRVFFTKDSAFICSYIALNNQNVINELTDNEFIEADVPGILGLFSTIKLQQHRVGLMVGAARQYDRVILSCRTPFYYMLENFFLTNDEIKQIENNPFFETDDGGDAFGPKEEVEKFAMKHLVSDKFGIGDTRFTILGNLYKSDCANAWLGLQTTVPTAATFVRGLIAGEFDPYEPIPPLNLQHFFNVYFCSIGLPDGPQKVAQNVVRTELTNFLVDVLDRLSTILINAPLGNGKHFGFGPEFDFRYHLNDYFSAHTYATAEWYTPRDETRFYLIAKEPSDFDRDWRAPALAGENLALLNRLIVQTLFPVAVTTKITPSARYQVNQSFLYKSNHWDLLFGFDYWYQGVEKQKSHLPVIPCDMPLDLPKACRPAAQQGKLFAKVGYYSCLRDSIDWHVSLNFDGTVFNKGIGQNYTLGLRFGLEF